MQKRKPVYYHPDFVTNVEFYGQEGVKRYWLKIEIDKSKKETIVVILKNPSRATKRVSDKTVFNVTNYIKFNVNGYPELSNIGNIVILNLIPNYETYSENLKKLNESIIDKENLKFIDKFSKENKRIIIAWGNAPKGLEKDYFDLKNSTLEILNKNKNSIFYVDKISKSGNPKHGQIWAYKNELKKFDLR